MCGTAADKRTITNTSRCDEGLIADGWAALPKATGG